MFLSNTRKENNMKNKIKSDLQKKSMSFRTLAHDMGCNYDHLLFVLNGKRPMTYRTAVSLRDSLNRLTDNTYHLTDFGY